MKKITRKSKLLAIYENDFVQNDYPEFPSPYYPFDVDNPTSNKTLAGLLNTFDNRPYNLETIDSLLYALTNFNLELLTPFFSTSERWTIYRQIEIVIKSFNRDLSRLTDFFGYFVLFTENVVNIIQSKPDSKNQLDLNQLYLQNNC